VNYFDGTNQHTFTYDFAGRLQSWTYQGNTVQYDYDAAGNLKNPHGKTLTFNAANEVEGFTYDEAGNLLQDNKYQYEWDGEGRLLTVKDLNGNTVASFTYRPDGLRETKTASGVTYHYHYDGSNLIRITDDNGQTVWAFTWVNGKLNTVTNASGDTFYYVTNYRGDVVRIVDENGATVANYSYDPWGKVLSVSEDTPVAGQPLGYAGYYYDKETKLYYLQARYYDPETARFLSRDQDPGNQDDPITQNAYTYVNNNPVMNVDPDGHWAIDVMWLLWDAESFAEHPSLSGAAWVVADIASFADPTGGASTAAHAGRAAKGVKTLLRLDLQFFAKGTGKFSKYDVGLYKEIKGVPGLDAHHVGQKAIMKKFIRNYDPNNAPAILVPKAGHTRKGPRGIVSRSSKGIESARQLLARDIMELRRVYPDIPNSQLRKLIELNKQLYPEMRRR
jgi:RHS repeat-associated protein